MDARLRAVTDLMMNQAREYAGIHAYDGRVQDLSPAGVAAGLSRLGGARRSHPHDEAHLAAFEDMLRATFGELEEHRRNPLLHVGNLDLAVYDREYAPAAERDAARRRHLASWPEAVDAAVTALDRVPSVVARALLGTVRGLSCGIEPGPDPAAEAARAAHVRLVDHVEQAAISGDPDPALGPGALARLLSAGEAVPVDLGNLARRADVERDRLRAMLDEACHRIGPGIPSEEVVRALLRDHPEAEGVLGEAHDQVAEVMAFTRERELVPALDGDCRVGPAPPSRRWAMAMMSPAAPYEEDGPSWYYVTPPEASWPPQQRDEWLEVFSRTTLPAITVHEVAPGHYAHARALRQAQGDVRRTLHSAAFLEGWAHYAEELCLEEGFRAEDPRYAVGVAVAGLVRVTRLAASIGVHTGSMTVDDAVARFEADAFLRGPAARSEAARATFDPTYGRYTWGKLEIMALRDDAMVRWGGRYSHRRFHAAVLELGSPPLGLIDAALGD